MADLRILNEGSARREGEGWIAVPNTILVVEGRTKIIVDPGNHPKLLDLMEVRSVWPEEIETVFLTHSHIDHSLNIRFFPDATIVDGQYRYRGTGIMPHDGKIQGTDIEIVPTPGHSLDHASLIVPTDQGKTAVCGDLYWWESDTKQRTDYSSLLFLEDPFAVDRDLLMSSRRTIMRMADRFIPGHGSPFEIR